MWWLVAIIGILVTFILDIVDLYFKRNTTEGCEFYTASGLLLAGAIGFGYLLLSLNGI